MAKKNHKKINVERALTNKDMVEASSIRTEVKKPAKKKNSNPVLEAAEKDGVSMIYHGLLSLIKVFLIYRTVMAFGSSFFSPLSLYRTVDQIFYVLLIAVTTASLILHNRKKGVVCLGAYFVLELVMEAVIYALAVSRHLDIPDLNTKMISTLAGYSLWAVLTMVYYKKRWRYLL